MKARIEKSKVRRMGVAHGSAILYKNGDRLPGGMIFRAYDDSETMQERGNTNANLFVQCPYCGEIVSVRSNSAKRNQSCGCMMGNHVGKNKPQEFPKGWIYDSDAGRDAHNHPLVNVHSKWDETDKATFRLGNLKSGNTRWGHSAADDYCDETYIELHREQMQATNNALKKRALEEQIRTVHIESKLHSDDEAFTLMCMSKSLKSKLMDNTVYTADGGIICHRNIRYFNNEPCLADFQFDFGDVRLFLENNGIIHEEDVYGPMTLAARQARDKLVADFCAQHGFAHVVISYREAALASRDIKAYRAFLTKTINDAVKAQRAINRARAKAVKAAAKA